MCILSNEKTKTKKNRAAVKVNWSTKVSELRAIQSAETRDVDFDGADHQHDSRALELN